jgi:tripartite-type tricarboxylate transporter receptor subunit TctC
MGIRRWGGRLGLIALLALVGPGVGASGAWAEDAESFFTSHNKLVFGTPSDAGGGYDTYMRLLSRFMPKYMPNNPTIVVQNIPAAGGMALANMLYNTAAKDGTFLALIRGTVVQEEVYKNPAVHFEGKKLQWVGNMNRDFDSCLFGAQSGVKTIADLYTKQLSVGASGAGAQSYSFPVVYNDLLGTKFKVIVGYPGTPERYLAIERGELDGACGITTSTLRSVLSEPLRDGKILLIAQAGSVKDPNYPNVPNLLDEAKTPEVHQALQFLYATLDLGRPIAVPAEVPHDRVELLRTAFGKAMIDPELVAEAGKLKLDVSWVNGPDTEAAINQLYATPDSVVKRLQAALAPK